MSTTKKENKPKQTNNNNRKSTDKKQKPKSKRNRYNVDKFPSSGGKSKFATRTSMTVTDDEYIGEIHCGNNDPLFRIDTILPVNPGEAAIFPWLSRIAANYQKYRFTHLEFYYKPEVTQYAPLGAGVGKVMLAAAYNADIGAPSSKIAMEDMIPNANDMPYQTIKMTLNPKEMDRFSDARFIRSEGIPYGSDIKTYDCANLFVATQGQTCATTVLGELHSGIPVS